jgi:hypothetical protein
MVARQEDDAMGIGTTTAARLAGRLRWALLAAVALDLVVIGGRVALYAQLLAQSGAVTYVLEPVIMLAVYGGIVVWATASPTARHATALRIGLAVGLITGALWIIDLALETFADLSGGASLLASASLLLGGFALWGVGGLLAAWRTGSASLAVLAAIWSAMICVLLTVTFGWLLTYAALPRLASILINDPDFLRSGWHDLRAFAIANSFDAGFSHLLGGLIIGAIVGAIGGWIGLLGRGWQGRRADAQPSDAR